MSSATYKHVVGDQNLIKAFRNLSDDMQKRTLAAGVKDLLKPILTAAKKFAHRSRDTGALEASLVSKVVNYPRTKRAVGLVGPDRKYYSAGRRIKSALGRIAGGEQRRPAKYAHLVEYGHVTRQKKDGVKRTYSYSAKQKTALARAGEAANTGAQRVSMAFVPAKPFIRPAVTTTTQQQAQGFYKGIARGFAAAVKKEVSAGRHVRG